MRRDRSLLLANLAALVVLLVALLAGWRDAAAFGLAVLVVMNLMVYLRERQARHSPPPEPDEPLPPESVDVEAIEEEEHE